MIELKKILLITAITVMLTAIPVSAKENVQEERSGLIQVKLTETEDGIQKEGVGFQCIKIADIKNGEYVLVEEYQNSEININEIYTAEDMEEATKKFVASGAEAEEKKTDYTGEVVFENLEAGVYLLKADTVDENYRISEALVSVPMWNEALGKMEYEVSVFPKQTKRQEKEISKKDIPKTGIQYNVFLYLVLVLGSCSVIWTERKRR